MAFTWLKNLLRGSGPRLNPSAPNRRYRPAFDRLEDRLVPITGVTDLTTLTPQALVNTLLGANAATLSVSNVKYTGASVAAGTFVGGANSIGVDTGIVLSSGSAKGVVGPNNSPSFTTINGTAGDAALDVLAAPNTTFDASVLEFDFIPKGNILTFNYVFGSEEYPEFVNSGFNDVFAFYINGQNVAMVPGTNLPVSINTINATTNSQFYVDNTNASHFTQMDAFTTVLPIVVPVKSGVVNHIKLAIADVSDSAYDSWVLISNLGVAHIDTYRPLRYVYHPETQTYDGNITVVNRSTKMDNLGPNFAVLSNLPPSTTVANAAGFTGAGNPYLTLPNNGDLIHQVPLRTLVKFKNPKYVYLSSFFIRYQIDITGDVS